MQAPLRSTRSLESLAASPAARPRLRLARGVGEALEPRALEHAALEPQALPPGADPDWAALEPRTPYARLGRPLLRMALLALTLPPALLLALPITLVNALHFGGLQRVLFRQQRVGRRGRIFWILKFRTMHGCDGERDTWRAQGDHSRVTRFGRFLRNTHLDELPQILNILRGEMDFIGPRPEMVAIHEWARERIPRFLERNAVRPGITGLAQITQGYAPREEQAYRRKLELDRCALACHSFSHDLEILARTALWMVRGRGWCAASDEARHLT